MKNKLKLFNRGIYFEALNRMKIQGIIGGAILVSSGLILMMSCFIELITDGEKVTVPAEFFYVTYIIPFVIVPMMLMAAFSYLRARKTSDFYHGIPIKRESMYFSTVLAAITIVFAILLVGSVIPLGITAITVAFKMDMSMYCQIMANTLLAAIFMISCFAMGVSLTGNGFTNFFVSLMIVFVPRIIISFICGMAEEFTPFLVLNVGNSLFNNEYNIIFDMFGGKTLPFYATVIYTLVVSCIYYVLGAVAFIKRKSEMAGKASAFAGVQVVTRMLLPFICLLGSLHFVLYSNCYQYYDMELYFFSIALGIVAIAIYFIYELITTKRITKAFKSLVWFPLLIVGVVVVGLIITLGSKTALAREVDKDKINYIIVEELNYTFFHEEYVKITSDEAIEIIAEAYNKQMEKIDEFYTDFYYEYNYIYTLELGINQGGLTFYREIYMNQDLYEEFRTVCMQEIYSDGLVLEFEEYDEYNVYVYPELLEYGEGSEEKIYNAIIEDLENISYEDFIDILECEDYFVMIEMFKYIEDDYHYLTVPITEKTPKAYETFYEELINLPLNDELEIYDRYLVDCDLENVMDVSLYEMYVVDPKKNEFIEFDEIFADDEDYTVIEETAKMFKTLEEDNNINDYDCIIILNGWIEIFDEYDIDEFGDYYGGDDISLTSKYYVSEEVAEEFVEYIEYLDEYSEY